MTTSVPVWVLVLLFLTGCSGGDDPQTRPTPVRYEAVEMSVGRLSASFPEATDTAVRDRVLLAVYCGVVHGKPVPRDFAMFSRQGDEEVRAVVAAFVRRARNATAGSTKTERIKLLWGRSWERDVYLRPSDCRRL